jgi:hypothetical protein
LAFSFWLVDNYVMQGRHDEAQRLPPTLILGGLHHQYVRI